MYRQATNRRNRQKASPRGKNWEDIPSSIDRVLKSDLQNHFHLWIGASVPWIEGVPLAEVFHPESLRRGRTPRLRIPADNQPSPGVISLVSNDRLSLPRPDDRGVFSAATGDLCNPSHQVVPW
jgi:hypothetical protein